MYFSSINSIIKEVNYILYSHYGFFYPGKSVYRISFFNKDVIIIKIILFFLLWVRSFFCGSIFYNFKKAKYDVLFYGTTINNKNSLQRVYDLCKSKSLNIWNENDLPLWRSYMYALPYLPHLFYLYYKSTVEHKKVVKSNFDAFWLSYGIYRQAQILLKRYKLRVVVMSNDHSPMNRSLLIASKELNIKTVYLQHASITNRFPPLISDYSFLDGMESLEKYKQCGNLKGDIFLSGSPRFDNLPEHKIHDRFCLGVALNKLDNLSKIVEIIIALKKTDTFGKEPRIIVRPHPAMSELEGIIKIASSENLELSFGNKESSFEFISKIDLLLANDSSIHLDSALMKVPSVCFDFSLKATLDWYGYIKNGLVKKCETPQELLSIVKNIGIQDKSIVQYYCTSFSTIHEGKVATVISNIIDNITKGKCNTDGFKTIVSNEHYKLYEYE